MEHWNFWNFGTFLRIFAANMPVNKESYQQIIRELSAKGVTLVAVSKTKPVEDIRELYDLGHRDFGENYVQELTEKAAQLPSGIRWHFIGHLQSNKVKYIAPFIHLIHGVDSYKLLEEINKQGLKNNRTIDCLLQVYIAKEETKFGLDESELDLLIQQFDDVKMANVRIGGLMGMASFTENMDTVREEFRYLKTIFDKYSKSEISNPSLQAQQSPSLRAKRSNKFQTLSMGMSSDYKVAVEEGSNMVRIGSLLFGTRN